MTFLKNENLVTRVLGTTTLIQVSNSYPYVITGTVRQGEGNYLQFKREERRTITFPKWKMWLA